jgi:hypothetical protein
VLDEALAALEALGGPLADPAVAAGMGVKLGKLKSGLRKTQKSVAKARKMIGRGKKISIQLRKLRIASKAALKAASRVGHPVIAEANARSAGFHEPGDLVELQIYGLDGTPCLETPQIVVQNGPLSAALDLGSVAVDESSGRVTLMMGEQQGGGSVTVTACGRASTMLLYNYGPKPPKLPKGFPKNLPLGLYEMSYSASGPGFSIPPTVVGTFELVDLRVFYDTLAQSLQQAVAAVSIPGCKQRLRYTSYDGSGFSIRLRLSCSFGGQSASASATFRMERVG